MEIPVVKPNATKVATKWALINLIAAIIVTYIIQFTNMDPQSSAKYLAWLPFFGFLFLTQKEYRDQLGGYITFGDGFSAGFRYAVFSGLLVAIFSGLYYWILTPAAWAKILDTTRTAMEAQSAPESTINKTMSFMSGWGILFACFAAAVMYTIVGAVVSLVGAAIFKKERSPFDIAENAIDPNELNS